MSYLHLLSRHTRFLTYGFALAFFSSFGQTFFIAIFSDEIRGAFDLSQGGFGLCYSIATLASGLTIIRLGGLIDAIDLRPFTVALVLGLAMACCSMGLVVHVAMLCLVLYVLRLTGQGLLSHTAMTSMARYFEEDRGKAISVAGFGFPAGEAVLPLAAVLLLERVGWRSAWLIVGLGLAVVLPPVMLWLLRGHGARHQAHLVGLARVEDQSTEAGNAQSTRRQWTRPEVMRDPRFYMILPAALAPGVIMTGIFFMQTHLVEVKGWTLEQFAACFAVFALAQLSAGVVAGPLVDALGARRLLVAALVPLCLSLVTLALSRHPIVAPVFMGLAGLGGGMASIVMGALWAEIYGVRHLGAIRALVTAVLVVGTASSPVSVGFFIDHGVPLDTILGVAAGYVAVAAPIAWIAVRARPG